MTSEKVPTPTPTRKRCVSESSSDSEYDEQNPLTMIAKRCRRSSSSTSSAPQVPSFISDELMQGLPTIDSPFKNNPTLFLWGDEWSGLSEEAMYCVEAECTPLDQEEYDAALAEEVYDGWWTVPNELVADEFLDDEYSKLLKDALNGDEVEPSTTSSIDSVAVDADTETAPNTTAPAEVEAIDLTGDGDETDVSYITVIDLTGED